MAKLKLKKGTQVRVIDVNYLNKKERSNGHNFSDFVEEIARVERPTSNRPGLRYVDNAKEYCDLIYTLKPEVTERLKSGIYEEGRDVPFFCIGISTKEFKETRVCILKDKLEVVK